jgi:CBS domain-containing protein
LRVAEVVGTDVVAVARGETCGEAARRMLERDVLGALVEPEPGESSPGIVTARDLLELVGEGQDPATTPVSACFTPEASTAAPSWSLEHAAEAMLEGGFRHLVVVEDGRRLGVVSIRDIVRVWTRERVWRRAIQIREALETGFPTFSGAETVREAARGMAGHGVGAGLVQRAPRARPRIVTERDVLELMAAGGDPGAERVVDHLSKRMTYSAPDWSLKQAAEAMIRGDFQYVVVVDPTGALGILTMRDILRRWLD